MSERSLKSADVVQLSAYAPVTVEVSKETALWLSALILAPFAVENGVDPDHETPKMAAREVLEWLMSAIREKRGE